MSWTATKASFGILPLVALLAGCSHTHRFNPDWTVDPMKPHPLRGKMLHLEISGVKEEYDDKAGGHTFKMQGVRSATETWLKKLFGNDRLTDDPSAADYLLKLRLGLKIRSSLQNSCAAEARWDIVHKGMVIAIGTSTSRKVQAFMKLQGLNCEVAYLNAFPAALDSALSNLSTIPEK